MGLTLKEKEQIKHKVAQGYDGSVTGAAIVTSVAAASAARVESQPLPEAVRSPNNAAELIIEVTGDDGCSSITMRPHEVSRLRGRYGRGPGFEKWVAGRIRDGLISFGGG